MDPSRSRREPLKPKNPPSSLRGVPRVAAFCFALGAISFIGWAPVKVDDQSVGVLDLLKQEPLFPSSGQPSASPTNPSGAEGARPYQPTRTEWLAMEMNSMTPMEYEGYLVVFRAVPDSDGVVIQVVPQKDVDRKEMNARITELRQLLVKRAALRGWDSWLRVREIVMDNTSQKN